MARRPLGRGGAHGSQDDEDDDDDTPVQQTQRSPAPSHGTPAVQIGSMVHYHPGEGDPGPSPGEDPLAAIVASVFADTSPTAVNLMVIAADGSTYAKQGVMLCGKGEAPMEGQGYCDVPGHEAGAGKGHGADGATRREKARELLAQAEAFSQRVEAYKKAKEQAKAEQQAAAKKAHDD